MSSDTLRLDCDTLVIGGGMAGLAAALRPGGKTIVATAGLGATAVSSGVMSSQHRDPGVDRWFLDLMQGSSCPYRDSRGMTDLMAVKNGLVPATVDFGDDKPLPLSLDGASPAGSRVLDVPAFRGRSCAEIAKLVDMDDSALDLLSTAVKEAGAPSVLLPPVLGITRVSTIRDVIERGSGARVYEYVTAPSVHGLRLLEALRGLACQRRDLMVLETARVDCIEGTVHGHMGTKGKREFTVSAGRVILATGGPLTGLRMAGDTVTEPLTGLAVGDAESGFDARFLSDHPVMYRGIGATPQLSGGFGALRAAGAVAVGFGLYEALCTGYYAGSL